MLDIDIHSYMLSLFIQYNKISNNTIFRMLIWNSMLHWPKTIWMNAIMFSVFCFASHFYTNVKLANYKHSKPRNYTCSRRHWEMRKEQKIRKNYAAVSIVISCLMTHMWTFLSLPKKVFFSEKKKLYTHYFVRCTRLLHSLFLTCEEMSFIKDKLEICINLILVLTPIWNKTIVLLRIESVLAFNLKTESPIKFVESYVCI